MLGFKHYLREIFLFENKNTHMSHLEDDIINSGSKGVVNVINLLSAVLNMLKGDESSPVKITTKWDGNPAIVAGIDPESKKFFVGTKAVFSKNSKANFTNEDIDKNHSGDLADLLKIALKFFPKLGIKNVIQGDNMFIKSILKKQKIDNENFVTFRPNTILYAVQEDSPQGREILQSKIGIVWHTLYTGGPTLRDMKASFNINISGLKKTKDVWFQDATFTDDTGAILLTKTETSRVEDAIKEVKSIAGKLDNKFVDDVSMKKGPAGLGLLETLKWFINQLIRQNKIVKGKEFINLFTAAYIKKAEDKVSALKTEKGMIRFNENKKEALKYIKDNKKNLILLMDLHASIVRAKLLLIDKLGSIQKNIKTFLPTENGLELVGEEGFVAIDKFNGSSLKFVNRLEFSKNNFTVAKDWIKGKRTKVAEPTINLTKRI